MLYAPSATFVLKIDGGPVPCAPCVAEQPLPGQSTLGVMCREQRAWRSSSATSSFRLLHLLTSRTSGRRQASGACGNLLGQVGEAWHRSDVSHLRWFRFPITPPAWGKPCQFTAADWRRGRLENTTSREAYRTSFSQLLLPRAHTHSRWRREAEDRRVCLK